MVSGTSNVSVREELRTRSENVYRVILEVPNQKLDKKGWQPVYGSKLMANETGRSSQSYGYS